MVRKRAAESSGLSFVVLFGCLGVPEKTQSLVRDRRDCHVKCLIVTA